MTGEAKVLLMRLYERTSERGTRYLYGRLGAAKVIAFIDRDVELSYGATAQFNVYLQAGDTDGQRQATPSTTPSTPRRSPRRSAPRQDAPADDGTGGRPFDDPIGDIG